MDRCIVCGDPPQFKVEITSFRTGNALTTAWCTDCCLNVCVMGPREFAKLEGVDQDPEQSVPV